MGSGSAAVAARSRRPKCSDWRVAHADDVRQWFRMTYRSAAFSAAACALKAQAAAENTGFPLQATSDGPNQPPKP